MFNLSSKDIRALFQPLLVLAVVIVVSIIALRYTDRNHRQTKAINVPMQDTHARFAVSDECLAIARADPCGEMIEVATKIEHAGSTRTEQQA